MTRRHFLLIGFVGLCVAWVWSSQQRLPQASAASGAGGERCRPVPTVVVEAVPEVVAREFPAKVRAVQRVELGFSVPGVLVELGALAGRSVCQGEVVARLDDRDYRNALAVAKANWRDAQQRFERTLALRQKEVVAEAEYDRAKAAYERAGAELRIREKALADTVLKSPFAGVIVSRYVENFEHINAQEPVVSIQDVSRVEVVLEVPERLVARGGGKCLERVRVRLDADKGRWFGAQVREFSAQADPVTRTFQFVLAFTPPADLQVLPGMTASVSAQVRDHGRPAGKSGGAVLVPASAVIGAPDGTSYVWLIEETPAPPRRVPVVLGEPLPGGLEVRSGLSAGQQVAVAGVHSLDESMLVRPMRDGGEGLDG